MLRSWKLSYLLVTALCIVSIMGLGIAGCAGPPAEEEAEEEEIPTSAIQRTYNLKMASQMPLGHMATKGCDLIVERAAELSGGKIKIAHFPAGELFVDKEIAGAVARDAIEIGALVGSHYLAQYDPVANLVVAPFVFETRGQSGRYWWKMLDMLNEVLIPFGMINIGHLYYGDSDGFGNNTRPLEKPEDFEGLLMRSYAKTFDAAYKAVGASPTTISSSEVYVALERGVLDGATSGTTTFVSRKWTEVCKYITRIEGLIGSPGNATCAILVNFDVWNNMEPAAQEILKQVVWEAYEYTEAECAKAVEAAWATIAAAPTVEKATWIKLGTPEWNAFAEVMGPPVLDAFIEMAGEVRGQRALKILEEAK